MRISERETPIVDAVLKFLKDFRERGYGVLNCVRCDCQHDNMFIDLQDGDYVIKCSICATLEMTLILEEKPAARKLIDKVMKDNPTAVKQLRDKIRKHVTVETGSPDK